MIRHQVRHLAPLLASLPGRSATASAPCAAAILATANALSASTPAPSAWAPSPTSALHTAPMPNLQTPRSFSSSSAPPTPPAGGSGSSSGSDPSQPPAAAPGQEKISLSEALNRLVDAAVAMVEEDRPDDAIAVLKEAVTTLEPQFPNSPEVGELHNQIALLLLYLGRGEDAASHAQSALEATQRHFSPTGVLAGHRMLRLGVAKFAAGKLSEAFDLLQQSLKCLGPEDPSRHEATLYQALVHLAGAPDAMAARQMDDVVLECLKEMRAKFGKDSMIVTIALSLHETLVTSALAGAGNTQRQQGVGPATSAAVQLGEALFKQHIRLVELVSPNSEQLAMNLYKLSTFYYSQDILPDAMSYIRQCQNLISAIFPPEHDLVTLVKHRMGMVCAASGDTRSAKQLLAASYERYKAGQGGMAALAQEALLGLNLAKYHSIDPKAPASERQAQQAEALAEARKALEGLAGVVGSGHMLVQGAARYVAQINVLDSKK